MVSVGKQYRNVQGKEIARFEDVLKKVDELMYADKMKRQRVT